MKKQNKQRLHFIDLLSYFYDKKTGDMEPIKKMANVIGVSYTTVYHWKKAKRIPLKSCGLIYTKSDKKFSIKELKDIDFS